MLIIINRGNWINDEDAGALTIFFKYKLIKRFKIQNQFNLSYETHGLEDLSFLFSK